MCLKECTSARKARLVSTSRAFLFLGKKVNKKIYGNEQWLVHSVWDREGTGSNPVSHTKQKEKNENSQY